MLCRPEYQAYSTNVDMQTIVFFNPTLFILIKCDLFIVCADEFNILGGSTHTIKKTQSPVRKLV